MCDGPARAARRMKSNAVLREIVPKLRRVVTFYNPGSQTAVSALKVARHRARLFLFLVNQVNATPLKRQHSSA
jgi:ABC-type uncharacterized transport system substrate-binding protein